MKVLYSKQEDTWIEVCGNQVKVKNKAGIHEFEIPEHLVDTWINMHLQDENDDYVLYPC